MKQKGLWILLGINIILAIAFAIIFLSNDKTYSTLILENMLGIILIEIPLALILYKKNDN